MSNQKLAYIAPSLIDRGTVRARTLGSEGLSFEVNGGNSAGPLTGTDGTSETAGTV